MSLSVLKYIDRFNLMESQNILIAASLALIVFLWLYIRTSRSIRSAQSDRAERLQFTLSLYCRAASALGTDTKDGISKSPDRASLIRMLQECKSAPLITTDLLETIDAYIHDPDESRQHWLRRTLEREIHKFVEEQAAIIRLLDCPSWGLSFWRLIKPIIPFAALIAIIIWGIQLLYGFQDTGSLALSWTGLELWARFISCLAATICLYLVLMDVRKHSTKWLYYSLYLFITAAALFHFVGLQASPYILAVQIILFLCGFGLKDKRSRRERPYAGHQDMLEQFTAEQTAEPDPLPSQTQNDNES